MDEATRAAIARRITELEQSLAGWQQTLAHAEQARIEALQQIQRHAGARDELKRLLTTDTEPKEGNPHDPRPDKISRRITGE